MSVELDAERVAVALVARGSLPEAVALLRAAVARDASEEGCRALLGKLSAGELPEREPPPPALTLDLVDRWIRRGMLVEALALLGGTEMARDETGCEWANLLGELLAPVPVDAEEALVEMHRHLLTGGASVALTVLEERERRAPALPTWASRRLALLRWMLLDNASMAQSHPSLAGGGTTALAAAVLDAVNKRALPRALEAARKLAEADPSDVEAPAVARCIETILAEIERYAEDAGNHARTLPMSGPSAVAMQLRMGNYTHAASACAKLLARQGDDPHLRALLNAIDGLLRAARGERIAEDDLDEPTAVVAMPPEAVAVPEGLPPVESVLADERRAETPPAGVLVSRIRTVE